MSSGSLPLVRVRQQARVHVDYRALSVPAVAAVTVALLVLFLWLRFFVAVQIESTGRQIQAEAQELERLERSNAALRRVIAESASQENLSARAEALDYQLQTPVFLMLPEPLAEPTGEATEADTGLRMAEDGGDLALPAPSTPAGGSSNLQETGAISQP